MKNGTERMGVMLSLIISNCLDHKVGFYVWVEESKYTCTVCILTFTKVFHISCLSFKSCAVMIITPALHMSKPKKSLSDLFNFI